ncbi:hypothetical protein [Streptomyces phaeochromogenes]
MALDIATTGNRYGVDRILGAAVTTVLAGQLATKELMVVWVRQIRPDHVGE